MIKIYSVGWYVCGEVYAAGNRQIRNCSSGSIISCEDYFRCNYSFIGLLGIKMQKIKMMLKNEKYD
jgi:hypothetical protein